MKQHTVEYVKENVVVTRADDGIGVTVCIDDPYALKV